MLTGISLNNLSVLETDKAKAIRFSTLSRALNCQPGDLFRVRSDADLVLNESDLISVSKSVSGFQQETLTMRVKADKAAAIAKLTRENLEKNLAVVIGGKILMAPRIREPISGESFTLSASANAPKFSFGQLHWLERMADADQSQQIFEHRTSVLIFGFVALVSLIGTIWYSFFAFRRRSARS